MKDEGKLVTHVLFTELLVLDDNIKFFEQCILVPSPHVLVLVMTIRVVLRE